MVRYTQGAIIILASLAVLYVGGIIFGAAVIHSVALWATAAALIPVTVICHALLAWDDGECDPV